MPSLLLFCVGTQKTPFFPPPPPPFLVTRGRFTKDYAKGLLAAPEDREPAVRKLVEGAGGKFVFFFFKTGDSDFLLITETNEAESAIAALLATAAAARLPT